MLTAAAGGGTRRRRLRGQRAAWIVLVATAAAVTGCSSSGNLAQPLPTESPVAAASRSANASPATAALQQYRAFWAMLPSVSAAPAARRPAMLAPYAADPELSSLLAGMRAGDRQGTVFYGDDVPRPTVASLSVAQKVAVIHDCQDSSHAGNEDSRTGRKLTVGVARHLVFATMDLGPDGTWRVASVSYENATC